MKRRCEYELPESAHVVQMCGELAERVLDLLIEDPWSDANDGILEVSTFLCEHHARQERDDVTTGRVFGVLIVDERPLGVTS